MHLTGLLLIAVATGVLFGMVASAAIVAVLEVARKRGWLIAVVKILPEGEDD